MLAENFVVKGMFFQPKPKDEDFKNSLDRVKNMLIEYLQSKGYLYRGPISFSYKYLEISFSFITFPDEQKGFFKKRLDSSEIYFKNLRETRNDVPWEVKIYLSPGKFKENEGVVIEATSKPAIFYKIVQMKQDIPVDESDYSFIIYTNKEFLEGIAKSLGCFSVKDPKPLVEYIRTQVSEKLKTFGFDKVANLMEKGRKEIELGRTQYGLDDLRASIENFFFELVKKLEGKPHPLHQPENNIALLESMGYLDGKTKGLIITTQYKQIYKILSEIIHKRESASLFDARLYFNLTEQIFDYLLEKIIRYKIKVK